MPNNEMLYVTSDRERGQVRDIAQQILNLLQDRGVDSKVGLTAAMNVLGFIIGKHYPVAADRLRITEGCIQALPQYVGVYQDDRSVLP